MPKYATINIKESLSELRAKRKKSSNHRVKTRILSLILIIEEKFKKRADLASHLDVSEKTLFNWLSVYKESGLEEMLKISNGGARRRSVPMEVHKGLEEKLNDSSNPLLGYWDAVRWVEEEFDETINYQTLRSYMIRNFKTKLKSPRKSHYKKDEQAIEAFKKTT